MPWGEQQSLGAQLGALRTQLEMAERARDKAQGQAKAWRDVADAWAASVVADTDDEVDQAVEDIRAAQAIAEALDT